jgi:5-hydroxyisourate hydrolase
MISLSTHVLDLTHGRPAAGMGVRLLIGGRVLAAGVTDADGRLAGLPPLEPGAYRLEFAAADYFKGCGAVLSDPPFLDVVAIEFSLAGPDGRYHVPLLVSPFGYSTYRGS